MGSVRMTQITALILRAISAGYQYGFDIMEACELPSGTVYPALRRLEKAGYLASGWESAAAAHAAARPRRKIYELTPEGTTALHAAERRLAEARRLLRDLPPAPTGEA
ncbi:MAG: PadR family transcriptional regulator [Gemmatimonadota bacterium]|nr:PadR family transcriptional regulator [Gemmatimonadota bacterium]